VIGRIIAGYTTTLDEKVDDIKLKIINKYPKLSCIIKVSRKTRIKNSIKKLFTNIKLHRHQKERELSNKDSQQRLLVKSNRGSVNNSDPNTPFNKNN